MESENLQADSEAQPAAAVATLTIVLTQRGAAQEMSVTGPIDNKLLCYGMLEAAKEEITNHHAAKRVQQKAGRRLVLPGGALPPINGG